MFRLTLVSLALIAAIIFAWPAPPPLEMPVPPVSSPIPTAFPVATKTPAPFPGPTAKVSAELTEGNPSTLSSAWLDAFHALPRTATMRPQGPGRPKELGEASEILGRLFDELDRRPAFRREAIEFLSRCAIDTGIYLPIRALCLDDLRPLDSSRYIELPVDDAVRSLAQKLAL